MLPFINVQRLCQAPRRSNPARLYCRHQCNSVRQGLCRSLMACEIVDEEVAKDLLIGQAVPSLLIVFRQRRRPNRHTDEIILSPSPLAIDLLSSSTTSV